MSRNTSVAFRSAVYAPETGEAPLILLTIGHSTLTNPLRFTSDAVDTVSRGNTYITFPFQIEFPQDTDEEFPRARIRIDNVSQEIIGTIRSISDPPVVTMEVVLASSPDTVEASWSDFEMEHVSYDAMQITGRLTIEHFAHQAYPGGRFTPGDYPALF